MRLILISSENDFKEETVVLSQLFECGLQYLHLRKPRKTSKETSLFLDAIPEQYHSRIVLHSCMDLAMSYNVRGLHINKRQPVIVDNDLDTRLSYSVSVHSFQEMNALDNRIEYAFLSPIFDSISKVNYRSRFSDKNQLSNNIKTFRLSNYARPEIIALGGVDVCRISQLQTIGFDGVACMGAIWGDAVKTSKKTFVERYLKLKKTCDET